MANSSEFREGIAAFVQKKASKRLRNTLFNVMPTLELILAVNGDKDGPDGLGRPRTDPGYKPLVSGRGSVRRESIVAEREYLPTIQTSKPSKTDVKSMDDYDNDPTVPAWETDNAPLNRIKQPRFKFARKKMPYKVPHSEVRTARQSARTEGETAAAIGSVYDLEVKTRMAVLCEVLNDELWGVGGQQGYPTNEDAVTWDHIHSIQNALKDDNTYGGVDRSLASNDWWQGNYVTDAFNGSFYDLIDECNYTLGMADKGLGVSIIGVGKSLFRKAKAEAKAEGFQLFSNGIPEFPEYGFKREVVRISIGNRFVYVYYDPAIPEGHAACLDPNTWTVAIHPDGNFKVSVPADQTKVEGGDEADTGTINVELLICCEVPKGNAYFTNVSY